MQPLPRQIITVPLAYGIDTKSDAKQIPYGKLLELENAVFDTTKSIKKRNGYSRLSDTVSRPNYFSSLDTSSALTTYRNELLCAARETATPQNARLYSYSSGADRWNDKGEFNACQIESFSAFQDVTSKANPVSALLENGLQVFAWEKSSGTTTQVFYSICDTKTKSIIGQPVTVNSVGEQGFCPMLVAYQNKAILYYVQKDTELLMQSIIDPSFSGQFTAPVAITSSTPGIVGTLNGTAANAAYDVCVSNNQIYLVFSNDAGGITCRRYQFSSIQAHDLQNTKTITGTSATSVCVFSDTTNQLVVIGYTNTYLTSNYASAYTIYESTFIELNSIIGFYVSVSGTYKPWRISGICVPDDSSGLGYRFFVDTIKDAGSYDDEYRALSLSHIDSNFSTVLSEFRHGLQMASKPFVFLGKSFVFAGHDSVTTGSNYNLQNQVFVISDQLSSLEICARFFYQTFAGTIPQNPNGISYPRYGSYPQLLSPISFVDEFLFNAVICRSDSFVLPDDLVSAGQASISSVTVNFSSFPLVDNRTEISGSVFFGGGIPKQYDGMSVTEQGFCVWPDRYLSSIDSSPLVSLVNGQYQFVFCYEWVDAQGYRHRSAPSLPYAYVKSTTSIPKFAVSPLYFTSKNNVEIVMYRTTVNGSVFYKDTILSGSYISDSSSASFKAIQIQQPDSTLSSSPYLYTTGGVVENTQPDSINGLAVHRGRVWGIDATDRLKLWYSKQVSTGVPVEFSQSFAFTVDNNGGDVIALGSIDDKLIVFKKNLIMMISGQGPDSLGGQNDFSDSMLVTTDCGCIDARSIAVTPSGLMFQGAKGIYLLSRSLESVYIGAPVEKYNNETVESAQLIPTKNQVRLATSGGVVLVYDYYVQQWSVFTNHSAQDTAIWDNKYCWLSQDGSVMVEDSTRFDDNGSFYGIKAKTGWITFGTDAGMYISLNGERAPTAMQSYQRARKIFVLGEYKSPHYLRVQVSYDYSEYPHQDVRITPFPDEYYGESSPYGNETPYGGTWQVYQWRVDASRQKCQAVQVTIFDEQNGNELGETVRLSAVSIDALLKTGPIKTPMNHVKG